MTWLRNPFKRTRPPPAPEPLPDGWTTSSRRYPAAVMRFPVVRKALEAGKDFRLNWDDEKRSFTLEASREQYPKLLVLLRSATDRIGGA